MLHTHTQMLSLNDLNSDLRCSEQIQPPFQKLCYTEKYPCHQVISAVPFHDFYVTKLAAASGNTSSIIQKQYKDINKYKLGVTPNNPFSTVSPSSAVTEKNSQKTPFPHFHTTKPTAFEELKNLCWEEMWLYSLFLIFKNYFILFVYGCLSVH